MTRLRLLVWLIALMALIAPPGMSAHAMAAAAAGLVGRLPRSCAAARSLPERGNGQACRERLLPADVGRGRSAAVAPTGIETPVLFDAHLSLRVRSLVGRIFTKDPPPPRV